MSVIRSETRTAYTEVVPGRCMSVNPVLLLPRALAPSAFGILAGYTWRVKMPGKPTPRTGRYGLVTWPAWALPGTLRALSVDLLQKDCGALPH